MLKVFSFAALGLSCGAVWLSEQSWLWVCPALALCGLALAIDVPANRPDIGVPVEPDLAEAGCKFGAVGMWSGPAGRSCPLRWCS